MTEPADLPVTLIPQGSNLLLQVIDPENDSKLLTDPARLMTAANGAAGTGRLYEPRLTTKIRVDAVATDTVLEVQNAREWKIGMSASIELDNDFAVARDELGVTAVDEEAGTITLSGAGLTAAASRGNRVRRILRATSGGAFFLSLAEYGVPAQNDETWGFQASATAGYELVGTLGAEILAELEITGTSVRMFYELFKIVSQNR